jgi:DNA-binding transcriptional LysR family regulator
MESDGFAGVELRHLRALVAVAEARSFSRAATRLGYAQSAVSQQIAALERSVGLPLVERPGGPRPVSLTEAGRVLVRHAEQVVGRMAAARADLHALSAGESGSVRVGTFQSAGARMLPRVLSVYRAEWPGVDIELVERQNDRELLELVAVGELDVSFGVVIDDDPRLVHRLLLEEPYFVLAPPDSPLAAQDVVHLADLDRCDFIGNTDCPCAGLIDGAMARAGAEPRVVFRTDDNLTVQRLVGAGLGHAVVPNIAIERGAHAGPAVVLPIADELEPRRIAIYGAADRYRSPAVRAFVDAASTVFAGDRATTAVGAR